MLGQPGRLLTKGRLLRAVWGTAYADEAHYLHVYVSRLRRKLDAADPTARASGLIVAEPGVGYRVARGRPRDVERLLSARGAADAAPLGPRAYVGGMDPTPPIPFPPRAATTVARPRRDRRRDRPRSTASRDARPARRPRARRRRRRDRAGPRARQRHLAFALERNPRRRRHASGRAHIGARPSDSRTSAVDRRRRPRAFRAVAPPIGGSCQGATSPYFRHAAPGVVRAGPPPASWPRRSGVSRRGRDASCSAGRWRATRRRSERLSKTKALAVFSSDNLSSVAYATEAILFTLLAAGTARSG